MKDKKTSKEDKREENNSHEDVPVFHTEVENQNIVKFAVDTSIIIDDMKEDSRKIAEKLQIPVDSLRSLLSTGFVLHLGQWSVFSFKVGEDVEIAVCPSSDLSKYVNATYVGKKSSGRVKKITSIIKLPTASNVLNFQTYYQ